VWRGDGDRRGEERFGEGCREIWITYVELIGWFEVVVNGSSGRCEDTLAGLLSDLAKKL